MSNLMERIFLILIALSVPVTTSPLIEYLALNIRFHLFVLLQLLVVTQLHWAKPNKYFLTFFLNFE